MHKPKSSSILFLWITLSYLSSFECAKQDILKCPVCHKVVKELVQAIEKEDPNKRIQVGSFRIDPDGNQKKSDIQYAASEMHLNEVMETLCNTMEDYAQVKHKETGKINVLKLTEDMDKMGSYDFIPDPDLNKGLKSHCENLLSDYDEDMIAFLRGKTKPNLADATLKICYRISGKCDKNERVEL